MCCTSRELHHFESASCVIYTPFALRISNCRCWFRRKFDPARHARSQPGQSQVEFSCLLEMNLEKGDSFEFHVLAGSVDGGPERR
jgi:hypothetical protein